MYDISYTIVFLGIFLRILYDFSYTTSRVEGRRQGINTIVTQSFVHSLLTMSQSLPDGLIGAKDT